MRALDPEVANAVRKTAKGLLPAREDNHPLGCHTIPANRTVSASRRY